MSSSADRIEGAGGRQYHVGLAPGEVAPRILLCGDPARADRVAQRFESLRLSRRSREFVTHTGIVAGRELSVMATGMGCDNTEIAVMELLACVERPVLIRVGSCGALQAEIALGELVISSACLRLENTSLGFVDPGYPAFAHHEVVLALVSAAEAAAVPYHVGITATAPGFYGWQGRKDHAIESLQSDLPARLQRQGVLNFEMETSTLFTLATRAGLRAGAVCATFANRPANTFIAAGDKVAAEDRAIDVALRALDFLESMDARRGSRGWFRLEP
jgi:uridine phosphorylase